jgi:transposase
LGAQLADRTDGAGEARMLAWADSHAPGRRVEALEGTGSFAAGLAVLLAEAGQEVVEIGGVKRQRGAKNDQIDAARAARQALAREHQTKVGAHGRREALRMILTTRQAILVSRTKAINELKGLIVAAPEQLRSDLRGCSLARPLARIEAMRTQPEGAVEHRMAVLTLPSIAARVRFAVSTGRRTRPGTDDPAQAPPRRARPARRARSWTGGCRPAARELVASRAGPKRGRLRRPVRHRPAGGKQRAAARHRLNRGGDRDLNRALHTVAITRMRCHPETRADHAKRTAQGKTHRDIRRCLKRALARRLYRRIQAATHQQQIPVAA